MAVTVFPGEQYQAPRSWTERAYPKLIYYNKVAKGGHFAAWEQPELFTCRAPSGVQIAALIGRDLPVFIGQAIVARFRSTSALGH